MRTSLSTLSSLLRFTPTRISPTALHTQRLQAPSHFLQTLPYRRTFHCTPTIQQAAPPPPSPSPSVPRSNAHHSFYTTHGRALLKAFTLAFFTYQVLYYAWITLETEEVKSGMNREIKSLEGEVRLLDEGRRSHKGAS